MLVVYGCIAIPLSNTNLINAWHGRISIGPLSKFLRLRIARAVSLERGQLLCAVVGHG